MSAIFRFPTIAFLPVLASGIVSFGWNWYHTAHHPRLTFFLYAAVTAAVAYLAYYGARFFYRQMLRRISCHAFWKQDLPKRFDLLYFLASFLFLALAFPSEWGSLVYTFAVLALIAFAVDRIFISHPHRPIRLAVRTLSLAALALFALNAILQATASQLYIFESKDIFANTHIILVRSVSLTVLWLTLFSFMGFFATFGRRWRKPAVFAGWIMLFAAVMFVWVINVGVLYFSGLYFNPTALMHAEGAGAVIWNRVSIISLIGYAISLAVVGRIVWAHMRSHHDVSRRFLRASYAAVFAVAVVVALSFQSFWTAPEFVIAQSFFKYFRGDVVRNDLSPELQKKLERFGLAIQTDRFLVGAKDKIYSKETTLLPDKFRENPPNIIIVFFESFSARLVNTYDTTYQDLTPGLSAMASDPHTTVFRNYYNSSSPTINGLITQLCSFLPPTGHAEIADQKKVKELRLLCLPKILRDHGYAYANYITAVGKDYASKDTIIGGMGMDEIYGTSELSKVVSGEPLSWGYSDHQLYPAMTKIIESQAKEPFLVALSTVDTHPPYTLAKDMVKYGDGKDDLLNSFHTADDAFRMFWEDFTKSPLYDNTIVVAVADHAIFPTYEIKRVFPAAADNLSFYDRTLAQMYIPNSVLPQNVETYASSFDLAPTLLHMLGINVPNSFEGHSIFDDRDQYPNLLGIHDFGLYANQVDEKGNRTIINGIPNQSGCSENLPPVNPKAPITLCELNAYYNWQRQMFEEGRLWSY